MKRVTIESPFRANTAEDIAANVEYGRACLRDSLMRGEAPFASHLLYTQPGVLDDGIIEQRDLGIGAGLQWQNSAEAVVIYTDRGISRGMELAIDRATYYGIPIIYRAIYPLKP